MAGPVNRLRSLLRDYFTPKDAFIKSSTRASTKDTTRKAKSACRYCRHLPPSERFIWAMVTLIISLIGLVAIELAIVLVTGAADEAILFVICSLVGALASRFLEAKG